MVYILDQVRALENEMLENLQLQGLDFIPKIVIVRPAPSKYHNPISCNFSLTNVLSKLLLTWFPAHKNISSIMRNILLDKMSGCEKLN